jgi:adenylate cyclase
MFELVFLTGARAGEVVPVIKSLIGGRSPDCSLEVPDPNASRQHARFAWDGVQLMVSDNGSSNGTYLNDQRLAAPVAAKEGDVVRLGETRLRVQKYTASSNDPQASSIFGFKKDHDTDLGQSIVMSVSESQQAVGDARVLAQRLQAIIEISKALVNIANREGVYNRILEKLFDVFPQADRGFLMSGNTVETLQAQAMRQRSKGVTDNLNVSTSICKKALESRSAFLFNDQNAADFDQGMSIVSLRIRSAMTIPLIANDEILGLLQIDTPDSKRAFNRDDLGLAVAICQQAAFAVHNTKLIEDIERNTQQRNNLIRYLPGALADQVKTGNVVMSMGGSNYHATLLFSDVIGFTRMSEKLAPEDVVKLMNAYFNRMVPCISNNAGSVDKFMGDAIMAVWGVPIDKGDSASNGVTAALSMHNALVGFNSIQAKDNLPQLGIGIGLNSGAVVAGNIGTEERKEYTVLGDTVNAAQRLESNAGSGQVLVSQSTWTALNNHGFGIAMPPLKVKNRSDLLSVFSIRGLKTSNNEVLLHVPVKCGDHAAFLVRRLADNTFILLQPAECDITAHDLMSRMNEWPDAQFGRAEMVQVLPTQQGDGTLTRCQIRLTDVTLAGLIADTPVKCERTWDMMPRAQAH